MERRFTPLAIVLGLAVAALLARLWDIQVLQHDVWARESANLVRAFEIDPYVRGTIRDRKGRPIVRDEEVYALEFVWREFRRGHPLGQIAMLRSLAVRRPVGLDETRMQLREAALSYASITPDELADFARGGALDVGIDLATAVVPGEGRSVREQARYERRGSRASDIAFYLHQLLGLSRREVKALRRLVEDVDGAGARSYLDLAGEVTDQSTEDVADALGERVLAADDRLARLAALIEWPEPGEEGRELDPLAALSPGDRLIALVEEQRRGVANEAADALFRIAAGFSPTRLSADNLRRLDLEWLELELGWDSVRLEDWIESRGRGFAREAHAWLAGHTIARAKIDGGLPADRVLSAIAHAFRSEPEDWAREHASPQDWRQVDEFTVVSDLPMHLDRGGRIEDAAEAVRLPFQAQGAQTLGAVDARLIVEVLGGVLVDAGARIDAERMRAAEADAPDAVGAREGPSPMAATTPERLAAALLAPVREHQKDWDAEDERPYAAVLVALHDRMQGEIAALLEGARPDPEPDGTVGGVAFADAPLEKAQETRAYVLRDRGGRSRVVGGPPDIELALLVSRYQSEFAGFRVTTRTRRTPVAIGPDGESPVAKFVIGKVRSPFLVEVLANRPQMEELGELQRKLVLPDEDRSEILRLVDQAYRDGETVGGFGLEAWLDRELSGKDGYVEWHGLQDLVDGNREPIYRGARDGDDVTLTLDIDLQRAAEEVLANPRLPDDEEADAAWFQAPVGAIVLARVTGEVLVAASGPLEPNERPFPWTDGQSANAVDRTLRLLGFHPPGSVMKPIVAAYALEHRGLDPAAQLTYCDRARPRLGSDPKRPRLAGWGQVNCNSPSGHSYRIAGRGLRLAEALRFSCNTYFAALGETVLDGPAMVEAYRMFGFGEPTGVRFDDDGERGRFSEDWRFSPRSPLHESNDGAVSETERQRLGNGLSHVDTTPMQVARAYAGLATGTLPRMTLVERVGATRVPRRGEPLGVSERHLEAVRDGLREVVQHRSGTAHDKGLGPEDLGFEVSLKTGTADLPDLPEDFSTEGIPSHLWPGPDAERKHTWVAGWFPSDEPRYVIVVYNHDTISSSSHGVVYVASQFLSRPEIRALLAEDAAAAGGEPDAARPVEAAASRAEGPR